MNKLIRYSALAAFVGAGASSMAHADAPIQMDQRDPTFNAGPIKVTLGGFTELAGIYRSHDEQADVGSSYYKIPFPGAAANFQNTPGAASSGANAQQYYEPEFRMSARQSRFGLLAQYAEGANKLEYYMETDFLSSGTTSNSNESNSYTLRMRHFYADWQRDDWYVLAGQTWSLVTPFSHGLDVRKQYNPLTIDAQYVVGFNWARQAQLRLVKDFGKTFALGLSLEEPQTAGVIGGGCTGTDVTSCPGNGSGLTNPSTTYSDDVAPDVVVKAALDPGFGHYELYSLSRFLHDRGNGTVDKTMQNHTTTAESFGASLLIPVVPKILDFKANGLFGRGNGRYGSGQLNDAVLNPTDGSLSAAQEQQFMFGLEAHPTKVLDLYTYLGMENQKVAYGSGGADSSGCDVNPGTATNAGKCGPVGTERMAGFGFWWKVYKGTLGNVQVGAQGTYLANRTLPDAKGYVGTTNDPMAFVSFRYYPFQ